jgi:hypothetical protein
MSQQYAFEQLHIDVARNSTDDFNPFHDPLRWNNISGNPFAGPIALGFQLEFLCSDRIMHHRTKESSISENSPPFRNFEFNFAGALRVGETFTVDVRKTINKIDQGGGLSNRVIVRKESGTPVLIGTQSDTPEPKVSMGFALDALPSPRELQDRAMPPGSDVFVKRKYMTTSNAKNFTLGALCRQHDYIDELAERILFPPLFTASFISCALLERGLAQGHDFVAAPLVYTNHQISVDMRVQHRLRSNDVVHTLVAPPEQVSPGKGLGKVCVEQQLFRCTAALNDGSVLFTARVQLAPLEALIG